MTQHRVNTGNFAEDREKASEAGKKGGQKSGGNDKKDPNKASDTDKKGSQKNQRG